MHTRTLASSATGLLATAAVITVLNAGSASAASPIVEPGIPRIGIALNPTETAALAGSPIPDLVDRVVPGDQRWISLAPGSNLSVVNGYVTGDDQAVIAEAASHPGGTVNVYLADPGNPVNDGTLVQIYQHWPQ